MMKQLRDGSGIGALVWLRGAVFVLAACVAAQAGIAQSVRLVPSTSRFAGDGTGNPTNDGPGTATTIPLTAPTYVASDVSGNIYISDTGNNCIRRVDTSGQMTVVVGQPTGSGDTCLGTVSADPATGVSNPTGVALDAAGNLFIADTGHNCVRRLAAGSTGTASLQPLFGSTCTELSSTAVAPSPSGLTVDAGGNLYIAINDTADGIYQVLRSSPSNYGAVCLLSGAPSVAVPVGAQCLGNTNGVVLNAPRGLTIDPVNNLYIADSGNACVRKVSAAGVPTTAVGKCTNDSTGSSSTALQTPVSVTSDAVGHLYINDNAAAKVYELLSGQLALVAGNGNGGGYTGAQEGKAAVSVALLNPQGLAADKDGNVYVADTNNNIVRILTQGLSFPETLARNFSTPQNLWFMISDAVTLSSGPTGDFQSFSPNQCTGPLPAPAAGQIETCQLSLSFLPTLPGLRTAPLTIIDSQNSPATTYRFGLSGVGQSAQAIFMPGTIKTLAKSLATPSAIAIDSAGDVYYAESTGGGSISELLAGSSSPIQLIAPAGPITTPTALALDAAGNLYIADSTANSIFEYDVNGVVSTLVSGLHDPVALAADTLGNLFVAEDGTALDVVQIYAGGQQAVIAGGGATPAPDGVPATSAQFVHPSALYLSPTGTLYVADSGAFRVYSIDAAGTIHRFAGNGTPTDSAPGTRLGTGLPGIAGISADAAGDLYIADAVSNRIFLAFSGLAHNPEVSVLAGDGTPGYTGDSGPANVAELKGPTAVAVDSAADVYVADTGNDALREITYTDPTLDFGTVKIGQIGGPLHTTLWNAGNDVLKPIGTMFLDEYVDFNVDAAGSNCGNSIPAGSTCDLSFIFTPQSAGSFVDLAHLNDTSANPKQTITLIANAPPPPVATIVAPAVTVVYGNAYTLAATIGGNQPSGPTGMATFSIGGSTLCGPLPLPANGIVSCSPSPTLEDVGTYTVTVSYSGDSNYPAATANITLKVTPRPVTITADNKTRPVNTANPPLTGTVVNVVPGQSITATYSTTAVLASPAGSYPITPAYTIGAGTKASNYTITVVNGTLTVTTTGGGGNPPGGGGTPPPPGGGSGGSFTLAATPPEQEIDHNGTVNYPVTLTSTGGFTGPITLGCSALPEGVTCAFAPASVTLAAGATGASVMTITATADTTNVPTVFSKIRNAPPTPKNGSSPLLAWTMLPLGLFGSAGGLLASARRRRRLLLLLVPFALLVAAVGMSGCASPSNYNIYSVTVTGTGTSGGATITQSSTVVFVLAR
jgi:sugar lactone lactonase YvrE